MSCNCGSCPIQAAPTEDQRREEAAKLIEIANRGREASREISEKYRDIVEYTDGRSMGGVMAPLKNTQLRLKKKLAPFIPYEIEISVGRRDDAEKKMFNVSLEGDLLRVGCQTVDAKRALTYLHGMCKQRWAEIPRSNSSYGRLSFPRAMVVREGIRFMPNATPHVMTWAEADRLLEYLTASVEPENKRLMEGDDE